MQKKAGEKNTEAPTHLKIIIGTTLTHTLCLFLIPSCVPTQWGSFQIVDSPAAAQRYPHALSEVAEICAKGNELGDESLFGMFGLVSLINFANFTGASLVAASDTFNQITEANHAFVRSCC